MASDESTETARVSKREKRSITALVRLYCRGNHHPEQDLCEECDQVLQYALRRLDRCPFGADRPVCENCSIHCYSPAMRERIRAIMKYSGPRMILHHPLLAIRHLWQRWKA